MSGLVTPGGEEGLKVYCSCPASAFAGFVGRVVTVPQFTVKHRGPAVFGGGREVVDWARNGQVGCPCLGCGWFSQSSPTEVAMQAAPGSLAFALLRDSKPTSWLQLSWLLDVSICLVMDAMGVGTGLDSDCYRDQ